MLVKIHSKLNKWILSTFQTVWKDLSKKNMLMAKIRLLIMILCDPTEMVEKQTGDAFQNKISTLSRYFKDSSSNHSYSNSKPVWQRALRSTHRSFVGPLCYAGRYFPQFLRIVVYVLFYASQNRRKSRNLPPHGVISRIYPVA